MGDLYQASNLSQLSAPSEYFRLSSEPFSRAILLTDRDRNILFANEKAVNLFGCPETELAGTRLDSLVSGPFSECVSRVLTNESRTIATVLALRKDGSAIPVEIDLHAIKAQGGMWVLAFIEDVTARQRAESAYRSGEERFREVADRSSVMICCSGPDKSATFFNKRWLAFRGRSMQEEVGFGWIEGLHPDDRDRALAGFTSSFEARGHCYLEYRLRRFDGEYRWVVCSGIPHFTPQGVFAGYIASCTDATEEKRAYVRTLATGVVHHFNNLLGGILALTENALELIKDGSAVAEELRLIRTATIRGAELVGRLEVGDSMPRPNLDDSMTDRSSPDVSKGSPGQRAVAILLVEDEELLRKAVANGLLKKGFSVLEACDGTEAIDLVSSHAGEIEVMLLDLTLPGATSREVFLKAKSVRPQMKIIVTSAHPFAIAKSLFEGISVAQFIRKPYRIAQLADLLQTI